MKFVFLCSGFQYTTKSISTIARTRKALTFEYITKFRHIIKDFTGIEIIDRNLKMLYS